MEPHDTLPAPPPVDEHGPEESATSPAADPGPEKMIADFWVRSASLQAQIDEALSNAPSSARKPYVPPKLTHLGSVRELTGSIGSPPHGGFPGFPRHAQ